MTGHFLLLLTLIAGKAFLQKATMPWAFGVIKAF